MQQEVDIIVNGKPVRQIAHEGKIFVIAKEGTEYEIRLKNNSTSRVTGVVSVDGLNVIEGEPAVPKGGGYIINGRGSYMIRGFRTSNDEVHPFVFNKKEKSYAAKSDNGDVQDCGVIGAMFWSEKEKQVPAYVPPIEKHIHHHHDYYRTWPYYVEPYRPYRYPYGVGPTWTLSTAIGCSDDVSYIGASSNISMLKCRNLTNSIVPQSVMMNSVTSSSPEFDMGTQFSNKAVSDSVQTVGFDWGRLLGTIKIYYASREVLEAMGVPVNQAKAVTFPEPFKSQGFCKPPKE